MHKFSISLEDVQILFIIDSTVLQFPSSVCQFSGVLESKVDEWEELA